MDDAEHSADDALRRQRRRLLGAGLASLAPSSTAAISAPSTARGAPAPAAPPPSDSTTQQPPSPGSSSRNPSSAGKPRPHRARASASDPHTPAARSRGPAPIASSKRREETVLAILEQFIERPPRDPRARHDVRDRRLRGALLAPRPPPSPPSIRCALDLRDPPRAAGRPCRRRRAAARAPGRPGAAAATRGVRPRPLALPRLPYLPLPAPCCASCFGLGLLLGLGAAGDGDLGVLLD